MSPITVLLMPIYRGHVPSPCMPIEERDSNSNIEMSSYEGTVAVHSPSIGIYWRNTCANLQRAKLRLGLSRPVPAAALGQ